MKHKYVIVGTTPYSAEVCRYISVESQGEVLAFSSHRNFVTNKVFCGLPIIPLEDLWSFFDMNHIEVLNTIGYTRMNSIRQEVTDDIRARGYRIGRYISSNSMIYSGLEMGGVI